MSLSLDQVVGLCRRRRPSFLLKVGPESGDEHSRPVCFAQLDTFVLSLNDDCVRL